jgi:osmoprotectant transport system permease protein
MPKIHNRVLLTLCCAAGAALSGGSFLNHAPNRLANASPVPVWEAPPLDVAAIVIALVVSVGLAFVPRAKLRSIATFTAAALLFCACLIAAGDLARSLSTPLFPSARQSPGTGFWITIGVALLAMFDALQRIRLPLSQRALFLLGPGLAFLILARIGILDELSLAKEFSAHRSLFMGELQRHLLLVAAAIALSLAIGVPLAVLTLRGKTARTSVLTVLGLVQTIPSIALFAILIVPLSALAAHLPFLALWGVSGTGPAPAIIALCLYALLPLVRNIATGFSEVPEDVKEVAQGLGFSERQMFLRVELPLAMPACLSGLRIVTVQAIGLATLAALIGAGGLGTFVFQGIGQYALDLVLLGALPVILLAFAADFGFQLLLTRLRGYA